MSNYNTLLKITFWKCELWLVKSRVSITIWKTWKDSCPRIHHLEIKKLQILSFWKEKWPQRYRATNIFAIRLICHGPSNCKCFQEGVLMVDDINNIYNKYVIVLYCIATVPWSGPEVLQYIWCPPLPYCSLTLKNKILLQALQRIPTSP